MNSYPYSRTVNMPFLPTRVTPNDVMILENTGIRYVNVKSANYGNPDFLPCLFVQTNDGWFSVPKLELAIITADPGTLSRILQNAPVILSGDQQAEWLTKIPLEMRSMTSEKISQMNTAMITLKSSLSSITDQELEWGMNLTQFIENHNIIQDCSPQMITYTTDIPPNHQTTHFPTKFP